MNTSSHSSSRNNNLNLQVLTQLILEEFNPLTEKFRRIRKCLQVFLPSYALVTRVHRDLLERASVSVLLHLIKVTPNSVLAQVLSSFFCFFQIQFVHFKMNCMFSGAGFC
jgi:hypothetical protein